METGRFTGKTALVTGSGGGIGQAIIARLKADGATVVATDLQEHDQSQADHQIVGDLMDPAFVDALPSTVTALTGRGRLRLLQDRCELARIDLERALSLKLDQGIDFVGRAHQGHGADHCLVLKNRCIGSDAAAAIGWLMGYETRLAQ